MLKNIYKFQIILAISICLAPSISLAAAISIPDSRVVTWQGNVGVPGGIPTVTTNCTTAACNTLYSGGANVTVANINAAIASAPNSAPPYGPNYITVVRIPAGPYNLGSGQIQINRGNVILRGAGKNQTILQSSNTGSFILTNGSGGPYNSGMIVSGYTKGSTSVTLNDASSVSVGDFINLTQDNESFMYADNGQTNLLMQLVYVTGVGGNVVSFDPPLVYGFSSGLIPRFVHYYGVKQGVPIIGYLGIEDMKIDMLAAGTSAGPTISLFYCYAPWVKNVKIANFGDEAIYTTGTVRGTVTGSYFNTSISGREGHGVYLAANYSSGQYISGVTGWLVENNYSIAVWATVTGANTTGSVIAYNYANDTYAAYGSANNWQIQSYITQHEAHEMMNLWEGNVGDQIQNDGYHGSGSHQTLFRNWIHGLSPRGFTLNRKMIDLDRFSYWHNVIGNVLGDSSWTPAEYQMAGIWDYNHPVIYRLGYPDMGNNGYTEGNPPQGLNMNPNQCCVLCGEGFDAQVQATLIRHMNFDYYTNRTIQCGDSTYAREGCQGVTGTVLPASLYLAAKPSWWCNESPWPAIGPDVVGYHGKIPAQIALEGGTCTHGNGDTTPPAAPQGLSVQ